MSLFSTSMLGLVTSSNLIQIYIFWELVGMCSYLLIGFWFTQPAVANACQKAFVTNRIGDFSLLLGILGFYWITGSFEFQDLFEIFNNLIYNNEVHFLFLTLCASLLFASADAKYLKYKKMTFLSIILSLSPHFSLSFLSILPFIYGSKTKIYIIDLRRDCMKP
ncbi:hypothetical protein CXB51_022618 [Gossypium anomalum]|uniref:NADH:quinone oxidoreductase/Mrp antiporter transmembrane domain-containing protein n=1 Tax=Gossypium anomalum TaxID=47600 RepID=A0A8J6CVG3_9ROSI|nr:hypothetical protein CXB51_022618 [Gossypium anomalum]